MAIRDLSDQPPRPVLNRMPAYLRYLKAQKARGAERVSSTAIASDMGLSAVQVRKDLACVNDSGRPRIGFDVSALIADIERLLGYANAKRAILVGAGHLGQALLHYGGFGEYGLTIVAAFDLPEAAANLSAAGLPVYPIDRLAEMAPALAAQIGIVAVPAAAAQRSCEALVACGVQAIWNFAPAHLELSAGVIVQNEDIAASLALLSNKLMARSRRGEGAGEARGEE